MKYCIVFLFSIFLLSGCVAQKSEVDTMQNRITQQEQTIKQLNAQLSGVQPAQADTWSQVQSLRQEVAIIKGQLDDFNNATAAFGGVSGMAGRIAKQDAALRMLETQFGIKLNLDEPAPSGQMGGAMPQAGQYPQTQQNAIEESQPPVQVQAPPAKTDVAQVLYDAGYRYFTERKYTEALNSFTDFTTTYPKHNLIGNAWFWKGESSFQLNNFAAAALDYEQVISKFASNQKVPTAYLKQAMCFMKTNKKDVARYRLDELIKKFPKSAEAGRAKNLLKEIK